MRMRRGLMLFLSMILATGALAAANGALRVSLEVGKPTVQLAEPIAIAVTVENPGPGDWLTEAATFGADYLLHSLF